LEAKVPTPVIAFIRTTALLTDALVASYVAAQQVQVSRDFAPVWGIDATCVYLPPGHSITAAYIVYLQDHVAQAGDAGFHDDLGNPKSYVAVADALANGMSWTVTASHETMEMLRDPLCSATVEVGGTVYADEVCDCCEDDQFGYWVAGSDGFKHLLSAFALPSWFDPNGAAPFTFPVIAEIGAPFALAPGGYIGERVLPDGVWTMRFAEGEPGARTVKAEGSRTMRRFRGEV
jgi:hypothetical protein